MNYLVVCEFDGRNFEGWQSQPNGNTVQDNIERQLERILENKTSVVGAGRTDAGVSALNYSFNFKTDKKIENKNKFLHSMNSVIDKRIYFKSIKNVDESFSARFSCKARMYRYYIYNGISPLKKNFAWQTNYMMDYSKMNAFLSSLKGKHDFSTFCRKSSIVKNPIVKLDESKMTVKGKKIIFTFKADRFLHNMIRFIVGTAVYIGRGKIDLRAEELLKSKNVRLTGKLAPADGLLFCKAFY